MNCNPKVFLSSVLGALVLTTSLFAIDLNGDGMSDVWEKAYSVPADSADEDPDGDGLTNLQESLLGTDPHDSGSNFQLTIALGAESNQLRLRFFTQVGKLYQLESSSDLKNWAQSGELITGNGDSMETIRDKPAGSSPSIFFRVRFAGDVDADGDGLIAWEENKLGTSDLNPDTDGDGMPDWWEFKYGLNPLLNDASADPDGDGFTNLQEYQNGTDPSDYYNGSDFNLDIVSGNGQTGVPGSWLAQPFKIQVTNASGAALFNAPVSFAIEQGGGGLAPSTAGPLVSLLNLRTDAQGKAEAFYKQAISTGTLSLITASSGSQVIRQVQFSASTSDLPTSGLRLWLRADSGIVQDQNANISSWQDQSGNGNDASQNVASSQPQWLNNSLNDKPTVNFNGSNNSLNLPNLLNGSTQGELFVVLKSNRASGTTNGGAMRFGSSGAELYYPGGDGKIYDDFGANSWRITGAPGQALDQYHIYNVASTAGKWTSRINGILHYTTSTNTVGFTPSPVIGVGGSYHFKGEIAEILVYDRVLSEQERQSVEYCLGGKYAAIVAIPTTPTNLRASAISPTQVSLNWNYTLGNVSTTFRIERRIRANSFAEIATVNSSRSSIDATTVGGTRYEYRVRAVNYSGTSPYSSSAAATTPDTGTMMPLSGIRLWLKADAGTTSPMSSWIDQSGNGNIASQVTSGNRPVVLDNQISGKPVVHFDGSSSSLSLPDFMSGATQGELFAVLKSNRASGTTNGGAMRFGSSGAELYYPGGDGKIYDDFGTNSWRITGAPRQALDQYHIYNVASTTGKWTSRINGILHYTTSTNTVGFTSSPVIGVGGSYYFSGDVAEILIYDQSLNDSERANVLHFLDSKYLIATLDYDNDGLTNAQEATLGTDPYNWDSNGDDFADGPEYYAGFDAASNDVDFDGLTNAQELALGTNPFDSDTDRDGVLDNVDAYPLDPTRWQAPASDPSDHTAPTITLTEPANAVLLP